MPEQVAHSISPFPFPIERYVDADIVASFVGYDRRTILRWTRDGLIRGYPPPGRSKKRNDWRYKLSEVDEDMRKNIHSSCRPCPPLTKRVQ